VPPVEIRTRAARILPRPASTPEAGSRAGLSARLGRRAASAFSAHTSVEAEARRKAANGITRGDEEWPLCPSVFLFVAMKIGCDLIIIL